MSPKPSSIVRLSGKGPIKAVDAKLAYLGIALRPQVWSYCRRIADHEAPLLYSLSGKKLAAFLGVDKATAEFVSRALGDIDLRDEQKRLESLRITVWTKGDSDYPARLRQIYDPPAALFVKGDLAGLDLAVAVVGARRCTSYGRAVAQDIARGLAAAGVTVVSGMARGIDSAAHIGALESGRTIAVLGCGLDIVYPPENRRLSERIIQNGAVVSEFPPGTPPRALNFPARNRVISGLSAAVVVVEASRRSGALITADFALEQGREVLVVPGSVRSPTSAGCHDLLKQGAGVAASEDDVFEAIGIDIRAAKAANGALNSGESSVLDFVDYEKTHVDEILSQAGRPLSEVLGDLSLLEAKGLVCRQAGGWYYRIK